MRKHRYLAVLAGIILIIGCVYTVQADDLLPEDIQNALVGTKVMQSACWEGPGSTWFVLIRTSGGANVLLCFELRDGRWIQAFNTITAVPQGKVNVKRLFIADQVQDFVRNRTWPGPVLIIMTDDGSYTSYQRSDSGQWNLFKVFYLDEQVYLDFDDESVTFRNPIDQDHDRIETVHGYFERDLRKVDINTIPKTPPQAQTMPGV